ncbi:TPA: hypothetical protein HA249_05975 [Candidatus Woesearchaeota archaeon]|nr:hypothetical protein [Candidatus Woesearchaeota archaeon]
MKIHQLYQPEIKVFSAELMPLPNGSVISDFDALVEPLRAVECRYFTITQPAPSTPKSGTPVIAHYLERKYSQKVIVHLTGGCHTPKELENKVQELSYLGIENVLALRGDPQSSSNGINRSGLDVVRQLATLRRGRYIHRDILTPYDFSLAVPCYPEGHPLTTKEHCWDDFKQKVEAGADLAFTQAVFLPEKYQQLQEWAQRNKITIPIIPGIFIPRTPNDFSFLQSKRVGVAIPSKLLALAERFSASPFSFEAAVDDFIFSLAASLLQSAPGAHFYSLNRTDRVAKIMSGIS